MAASSLSAAAICTCQAGLGSATLLVATVTEDDFGASGRSDAVLADATWIASVRTLRIASSGARGVGTWDVAA